MILVLFTVAVAIYNPLFVIILALVMFLYKISESAS